MPKQKIDTNLYTACFDKEGFEGFAPGRFAYFSKNFDVFGDDPDFLKPPYFIDHKMLITEAEWEHWDNKFIAWAQSYPNRHEIGDREKQIFSIIKKGTHLIHPFLFQCGLSEAQLLEGWQQWKESSQAMIQRTREALKKAEDEIHPIYFAHWLDQLESAKKNLLSQRFSINRIHARALLKIIILLQAYELTEYRLEKVLIDLLNNLGVTLPASVSAKRILEQFKQTYPHN